MKATTIQIVEFTHPGVEYEPKSRGEDSGVIWDDHRRISGIRKWNPWPQPSTQKSMRPRVGCHPSGCEADHKRKFIQSCGEYVCEIGQPVREGCFTFWGEWEPQSRFRLTGRRKGDPPYCIHEPFLGPPSDEEKRGLNTDPYVFGPCFWYTNCKQDSNNGKFLRTLAPGSVILFGTEKAEGFFLDTVFVVGDGFDTPIPGNLLSEASIQIRRATFDCYGLCQQPGYTFYRGLMIAQSSEFFSFVPGNPYGDSGPTPHDRPLLTPASRFGLRGLGTRTARLFPEKWENKDGALPIDFVKERWRKIAQHCIDQGFRLITRIEEPEIEE